jgi:hypothetical protein
MSAHITADTRHHEQNFFSTHVCTETRYKEKINAPSEESATKAIKIGGKECGKNTDTARDTRYEKEINA